MGPEQNGREGDDAVNTLAGSVQSWIEGAIAGAPDGHVPLLLLSGPQGAGKSTALAAAIRAIPQPVAGASIDDFYLTHAERMELARRISPLFMTRGPPGTHDLTLLQKTVAALRTAEEDTETPLPVFDKLKDNRAPVSDWHSFTGRPAAIVVEGWLMGALPDAAAAQDAPLNPVEAEDRTGDWRGHQEIALAGAYGDLWDAADGFCHIVPPDFDCVLGWRLQQEAGLWDARGEPMPKERRDWVRRFIQHYERLTRRMIAGGRRPGVAIYIDANRAVFKTSGY
jgi:D-glycerate 3-kinase